MWQRAGSDRVPAQAALLREIAGPLHQLRSAPAIPSWAVGQVRHLAEGIIVGRAFDALPVLGDALEEAGCTDAEVLAHCHGPGPHAMGCWVVSRITGDR